MNSIDILEELKEWFNNFDLDSIKHKPEEYIQAISNLIAENKELKEEKEKAFKEGYIKGIQPQILENWNNEQARIVKVKSQFIPISVIEKKIEELEYIKIKTQRLYPHTYTAIGEWLEAHYKIKILQEILDERNNTDEH